MCLGVNEDAGGRAAQLAGPTAAPPPKTRAPTTQLRPACARSLSGTSASSNANFWLHDFHCAAWDAQQQAQLIRASSIIGGLPDPRTARYDA
jgi:hypothetical protein